MVAFAITLGKRDGERAVTRGEVLAHARALVQATDLPVSADMENGYGDEPEAVAETVRLAASVGLVGCSIEDATGDRHRPIYANPHAVERIKAAVEAARDLAAIRTVCASVSRPLNVMVGPKNQCFPVGKLVEAGCGVSVLDRPSFGWR